MANENRNYVRWVRLQPCMLIGRGCLGRIEAHHAGRDRAFGRRAHDDTCIPLCQLHHRHWHSATGPFRHMNKLDRRTWSESAIKETRERYENRGKAIAF